MKKQEEIQQLEHRIKRVKERLEMIQPDCQRRADERQLNRLLKKIKELSK